MGGTQGGVPPSVRVPPWPGLTGYPRWGTPIRYPLARSHRGVPKVGYPLARSDQGVPVVGYPLSGYPPIRAPPWPGLMEGYLRWGTPLSGTHPARSVGYPRWGTPPKSGYPPWVWTDRRTDSQNITFPSYYVRGR